MVLIVVLVVLLVRSSWAVMLSRSAGMSSLTARLTQQVHLYAVDALIDGSITIQIQFSRTDWLYRLMQNVGLRG